MFKVIRISIFVIAAVVAADRVCFAAVVIDVKVGVLIILVSWSKPGYYLVYLAPGGPIIWLFGGSQIRPWGTSTAVKGAIVIRADSRQQSSWSVIGR